MKCMQIKKHKIEGVNSTGKQGNTKEKCPNCVTLCATSSSVKPRAVCLMFLVQEDPAGQPHIPDGQGVHSQPARASFIWLCPGMAAVPLDRERCAGLGMNAERLFQDVSKAPRNRPRLVLVPGERSGQPSGGQRLLPNPKHSRTLGQYAVWPR